MEEVLVEDAETTEDKLEAEAEEDKPVGKDCEEDEVDDKPRALLIRLPSGSADD